MAGHRTVVMGVEVEVLPRIARHPERIFIEQASSGYNPMSGYPGIPKWDNVCLGAVNEQLMCEFTVSAQAKSMSKPPGPPVLRVGIIQILLKTHRIALFRDQEPPHAIVGRVTRPGSLVKNGMLDCGTRCPPWLQGKYIDLPRPAAGAAKPAPPMVVRCGDNPRWTFPVSIPIPGTGKTGVLSSVELRDDFRTFVVAFDGKHYYPMAQIEWGTNICYKVELGARAVSAGPAGKVPRGMMTMKTVWADEHWSSDCRGLITGGDTANEKLTDRFRAG